MTGGFATAGFVAAVIGHGADVATAIGIAGGRIGEVLDWGAMPTEAAAVLAVEAERADDAVLAEALPGIAAMAEARDLPVVIAFSAAQIDPVAAALMGSRAVLLCEPDMAERVAALAVAGSGGGATARLREGADERLRRLNAEVARIAALLAGLVEDPPAGDRVGDRRTRFAAGPAGDGRIEAAEIRRLIRARRLRAQFFDARLLEDPGWDMLLDLFAAELERAQVSVSSLCIAAGVAPTTALRWITRMVEAGLLVRVPDAGDRRRAFLELATAASDAMRAYVAAARRAGLPVV